MLNKKMRTLGACRSVIRELFEYGKKRKAEIGDERVFDFSLGNPSVEAPKELTQRLISIVQSEDPVSLHGYTSADGDLRVRSAIAKKINERYGENITPDCIYMTVGAAGALTSSISALMTEGEEAICLTPYFPEYKVFIERCGGVVKEVPTKDGDFSLDIEKIREAINEKTALVIINSPNNPTGVIYSEEQIIQLSQALREESLRYGKTIYLISDEPYRELVYTDKEVPYLTKYYDNTVVAYSYSKSLSLPGDRIGYALISPRMENFKEVREAIMGAGRALGFVCAPSLFQRLILECVDLEPRLCEYRENGKILYDALTEYGYAAVKPEGAFYLFVKALEDDAAAFSEVARNFELLLVPSESFGTRGYVRIAYCVTRGQVERSLPAFKALIDYYRNRQENR